MNGERHLQFSHRHIHCWQCGHRSSPSTEILSFCLDGKEKVSRKQISWWTNESIWEDEWTFPFLMKHLIDVSISFRFLSSSINLTQPFAWKWLLTPSSRATIFILTCVHARSNLSRWLTMSGLRLSAGEKDNAYKHLTLTISLCDTIELRKTEREPSSLIISSTLSLSSSSSFLCLSLNILISRQHAMTNNNWTNYNDGERERGRGRK